MKVIWQNTALRIKLETHLGSTHGWPIINSYMYYGYVDYTNAAEILAQPTLVLLAIAAIPMLAYT